MASEPRLKQKKQKRRLQPRKHTESPPHYRGVFVLDEVLTSFPVCFGYQVSSFGYKVQVEQMNKKVDLTRLKNYPQ